MKVVVFSSVVPSVFSLYLKFLMFFASFTVSGRAFHSTGPLKLKVFLSNSDLGPFTCSLFLLYRDIVNWSFNACSPFPFMISKPLLKLCSSQLFLECSLSILLLFFWKNKIKAPTNTKCVFQLLEEDTEKETS